MVRTFLAGFLLIGTVNLTGCSKERPRAAVSGTVTWDGKSVANGSITFQLADSPAVSGVIQQGSYHIDSDQGVYIGTARVAIEAFAEDGGEAAVGVDLPRVKTVQQFLPAKYNYESILQVEIKEGRNQANFALLSH